MGDGYSFKCSKCGKGYSAYSGIGYLFPVTYRELMQDIKNGKYGQEWQDTVLNNKSLVTDAETHIYLCGKCNHWISEPGLSLYVLKSLEDFDDIEESSYIMPEELKQCYRVIKRRVHRCICCGSVMHRAKPDEVRHLTCPDCGGEPEGGRSDGAVMWD